jgi:hypothetical protein
MIYLDLHDIVWCPAHGHPALVYREAGGDLGVTIGVAAEDAQLLAGVQGGGARQMLLRLLEEMIAALGATPVDVRLSVSDDRGVRAELLLAGPTGLTTLPIHAADGLIVARRAGVPVRMRPADLSRLRREADRSPTAPESDPLAAFRAAVEALDLDGLGDKSPPAER